MLEDKATKECEDFLNSGRKLNEWTEEEVEVPVFKPELDEKNKRVHIKATVEKVTQKTYYSNSTPRRVICSNHFYLPLDLKKQIFKCKRCDYHFKANTLTHKYNPETGKICFRATGEPIGQ